MRTPAPWSLPDAPLCPSDSCAALWASPTHAQAVAGAAAGVRLPHASSACALSSCLRGTQTLSWEFATFSLPSQCGTSIVGPTPGRSSTAEVRQPARAALRGGGRRALAARAATPPPRRAGRPVPDPAAPRPLAFAPAPRGRGARADFRGRSRAALGRRARNAVRAERRRRRQWRAARRRRAESHGRRRSSPRHWPRCWSCARPAITMVAAVERSLPRRRRLSSQTAAMQAHRRQ